MGQSLLLQRGLRVFHDSGYLLRVPIIRMFCICGTYIGVPLFAHPMEAVKKHCQINMFFGVIR